MASPHTKEDYQIGIICALHIEAAAMIAMLDESHPALPPQKDDPNDYSFGHIGAHNVIIACLPAGIMGNTPAATVANNMKRSFPINIGLMVGIGGGVPSKKLDIRLGDIAVSQPTGAHGGVIQWDFGKTEQGGEFHRSGTLGKPPAVLLNALQSLKIHDINKGIHLEDALTTMAVKNPRMVEELDYAYQGTEEDRLFQSTYDHPAGDTCEGCDAKQTVERKPRKNTIPKVFYGNIASGNQVMKHGTTRDRISKKEGVICFEMEAAGLMDNFPCLVIRGICDYADSHKSKIWQPYAAATAAAFARVFLGFIKKREVIETSGM
jgi:nucleoside phosphorylase